MKNKKSVITTGVVATFLGLLVVYLWPWLQMHLGGLVTPQVKVVASWISLTGFLGAMGYANFGVIPMNSKIRLSAYAIGMFALVVTLLADRNTGNIFLEAFLLTVTLTSLLLGQQLQPVKTTWKAFGIATAKLAVFVAIGLVVAWKWPVSSGAHLSGWYWKWIALSGGILISAAIFLLESGFFRTLQGFAKFYAIGNLILAVSYLGEYNFVGIVLNVSLGLILLYVAFCEEHKPEAAITEPKAEPVFPITGNCG